MSPAESLQEIRARLESIQSELDLVIAHLEQKQKEMQENESPPVTMPRPGNMNEVPHMPGLG